MDRSGRYHRNYVDFSLRLDSGIDVGGVPVECILWILQMDKAQ